MQPAYHNKHFITNILSVLLILVFLGCTSTTNSLRTLENSSVQSTSVLDRILSKGVIRVGTTGDYMPYSYHLEGDTALYGIDVELARDFSSITWSKATIDQDQLAYINDRSDF